jgi:GxxExxY protein
MREEQLNRVTQGIIGAAIEVHRHLGPGLLESVYEACLCHELGIVGLRFERQVHLPVVYKGLTLESAYRADLIVEDLIVVEIKATEETAPVHHSQLLTYLKVSNRRVGLLINFNMPVLTSGLKRIVNRYAGPAPREEKTSESLLSSPRLPPRLRVSASIPDGPQ